MNLFILTCFLCFVVCSTLSSQGSDASADPAGDADGPVSLASSDQGSPDDDDDLEINVERSGGKAGNGSVHGSPDTDVHPKGGKKKKGKGKKRNKSMSRSTTPFNPEHTLLTSGYTSTLITDDPCTSTHEHYCIHGSCKYIDSLQEPVCTCWKDYDGERCEIHSLGSKGNEGDRTELAQTFLVIIAVVLSVISCLAILLMTCAHYRSQKNYLASYLGTVTEQEKHTGVTVL